MPPPCQPAGDDQPAAPGGPGRAASSGLTGPARASGAVPVPAAAAGPRPGFRVSLRPPGRAPATVLSIRPWVTWARVRCENLESTRAARPATMPLAVLVELIVP